MQGQLDRLAKSNARIEQSHAEILQRLDTIDAGQAGLTDLVPILETMLARMIDDRAIQREGIQLVAEVAAFFHPHGHPDLLNWHPVMVQSTGSM
jgi:hypothetical protein